VHDDSLVCIVVSLSEQTSFHWLKAGHVTGKLWQ